MPPKSNVPIRICGSKTRSGCRTCKQRHVKCDERRPACLKCQKGNRECVYDGSSPQTPHSDSSCGREISPYGPHNVAEVSAIKDFAGHLGREFAGSFSDRVWCDIFPRIAQHEPAIWSGLVAVSTLEHSARLPRDSHIQSSGVNTALKHYNRAIHELNTRLASVRSTSCKDVILLSCILFTVFECLQSRYDAALRHITGGMKLLMEWTNETLRNNKNTKGAYLDRTSLLPIFFTLDSQAVQMGAAGFRDYCSLPAIQDHFHTPSSFATLEEASTALNYIFNRLSRWATWIEPSTARGRRPDNEWMEAEKNSLQRQLSKWDSAFELPLQLFHPQSATYLLLAQKTVLQIFYNKNLDGSSEMEWDNSLPLFREAVEYAEAYMELTASDGQANVANAQSQPRPVLAVAMDIVLPLFLITTRCRDANIRQRALSMLKVCGRKEGIWDSDSCARIAEQFIEMEEKHAWANGFIPASARIYGLDVRLDDDKGAEITQKKEVEVGDLR